MTEIFSFQILVTLLLLINATGGAYLSVDQAFADTFRGRFTLSYTVSSSIFETSGMHPSSRLSVYIDTCDPRPPAVPLTHRWCDPPLLYSGGKFESNGDGATCIQTAYWLDFSPGTHHFVVNVTDLHLPLVSGASLCLVADSVTSALTPIDFQGRFVIPDIKPTKMNVDSELINVTLNKPLYETLNLTLLSPDGTLSFTPSTMTVSPSHQWATFTFKAAAGGTRDIEFLLTPVETVSFGPPDAVTVQIFGNIVALQFVSSPVSAISMTAFDPAPSVRALDENGFMVSSFVGSVELTVFDSDPVGGSILYNTTVDAVSGIARFPNVAAREVGTYRVLANVTGMPTVAGDISLSFTVGFGEPHAIVTEYFAATIPAATDSYANFSVRDSGGNLIETFTDSLTLSLTSAVELFRVAPASPVAAIAGVTTFGPFQLGLVGTYDFRIEFAPPLPGASGANATHTATCVPGVGTRLAFIVDPAPTAVSMIALDPQPAVEVTDDAGNRVTDFPTDAIIELTLSVKPSPGTGVIVGGSAASRANVTDGVANWTGVAVDIAGDGYAITAAKFSGAASYPLISATSTVTVSVGFGAPSYLTWKKVPVSECVAAENLRPVFIVNVRDAGTNIVTSANLPITLTLAGPTTSYLGTGSKPSTCCDGGAARFGNIKVNLAGTGYVMTASSPGIASISTGFDIIPGDPHSLVAVTEPDLVIESMEEISFVATYHDAGGNFLESCTAGVSISLTGSGPPSGSLFSINATSGERATQSSITFNATAGVVNVTLVAVDVAGSGYTLTYGPSADGVLQVSLETRAFSISVGPPASLSFSTDPTTTTSMETVSPSPSVAVRDLGGNLVVDPATGNVSIGLAAGSGAGAASTPTLLGTIESVVSSGIATFGDLSIDKATAGYMLEANLTSPHFGITLGPVKSAAFEILVGAPYALVSDIPPNSGGYAATIPFMTQPRIGCTDRGGNIITSGLETYIVTVSWTSGPAGGAVVAEAGSSLFVSFSGAHAQFSGLHVVGPGTHVLTFMTAFNLLDLSDTTSIDASVTAGDNHPSGCPSGLAVWLDFDDDPTTIVDAGNSLTTILDKSGHRHDFQSGGTSDPSFKTEYVTSTLGVKRDAVYIPDTAWLQTQSTTVLRPKYITIFVAWRPTRDNLAYQQLLHHDYDPSATSSSSPFYSWSASVDATNGKPRITVANPGFKKCVHSKKANKNNFWIITARFDGSKADVWRNNADKKECSVSGEINYHAAANSAYVTIGNVGPQIVTSDNRGKIDGHVMEVIAYPQALTDTEVNTVYQYLEDKWF